MVTIKTKTGVIYHVTTVRIPIEAYYLSKKCEKSMSKLLEAAIYRDYEERTK